MARKATKFQWTAAQKAVLQAELEWFEENIRETVDVTNAGQLTAWKSQKVTEIMSREEFSDLDATEHTSAEWREGIRSLFNNLWYNKMQKSAKEPSENVAATASNVQLKPQLDSSGQTQLDRLLRGFVLFSSELPAREYFATQNPSLIEESLESIQAKEHVSAYIARKKAISASWKSLTSLQRHEWRQRAEQAALDVKSNQAEFSSLVGDALQDMFERGRLGTGMVCVRFAFRDGEDLQTGSVYAGIDSSTKTKIKVPLSEEVESDLVWRQHAELHLPCATQNAVIRDCNGLPVCPEIDLETVLVRDIASQLSDYLTALYYYAYPSNVKNAVAVWNKIDQEPNYFYDVQKFSLPAKVSDIIYYRIENAPKVYNLYAYFRELQNAGQPFRFYAVSESDSDSSSDGCEVEQEKVPAKRTRKSKKDAVQISVPSPKKLRSRAVPPAANKKSGKP